MQISILSSVKYFNKLIEHYCLTNLELESNINVCLTARFKIFRPSLVLTVVDSLEFT